MKNRLKDLRKARNWSQAELARTLEISRQAINGFESGKFTPSLEMALKIALVLNVTVEEIFIYKEKTAMQNLLEKVENIAQWLPKGEKFTYKVIEAIRYAKQKAALSKKAQVEPEHLLYGLLNHPTTNAARLLREYGLTLDLDNSPIMDLDVPEINKFTAETKYVLETSLSIARLRNKKYIDTEHLLLALIQLMQLGNEGLQDIFLKHEVDTKLLLQKLTEVV